ncbi:MAG: 5'-methylthioadenosine/adenosylhomocysteine nucleosidase [Bacilli bacterium]|nr:5'-methylthioadenosine/adenosylhomocysteine nucleosidase [Bacilli bacterium]
MKKSKLTVLLSLPLLLLSSCNNEKPKEYIGIISAMDNEIALLLKQAEIEEERVVADTTYYVGTLKDKPVVITHSGIGKIRASSGATTLFNTWSISKLIFTGVAGGLRDEEKVLDQVVGTSVIEHDYGSLTDEGFTWCGGDPGKLEPGEHYECDKSLVDLAYESALSIMDSSHIFKGCIATGDQFIASSDYVKYLVDNFDAYACEMEGAAIGKICVAYEVPFVLLRTLSDKADGEAHESYENFMDLAAEQSNKIVMKMLESL